MTSDDLDDLIGGRAQPPPPLDRDTVKDPRRFVEHQHANAAWFARALGIDLATVEERLADCPEAEIFEGEKLYVIAQACPFILPSEVDFAGHVRTLQADDLPPQLHPDFWSAKLKRLKVEEQDGRLFRSDDVLAAMQRPTYQFRNMAMMAFWGAEHSSAPLSNEQREELRGIIERMLNRIPLHMADLQLIDSSLPVIVESAEDL